MNGVRASAPVCLGVIPVGISFGLLAVQAGLTSIQTILMSVFVMAGSSQIMAVGMIGQGAVISTIVIATFFINLRHVVMSSSVMNRLRETPLLHKLVGAFALCDESFAIFSLSGEKNFSLLLGANTALYGAWVGSTVIGCLLNLFLPNIVVKSFGIAFYAAFIAMLMPRVLKNHRLIILVILTAGINSLLQLFLPASWGVICSMILGAGIGTFVFDEDIDQTSEKQTLSN